MDSHVDSFTIAHSPVGIRHLLHIQVSAGDESRMAGDGGVLYGRRR